MEINDKFLLKKKYSLELEKKHKKSLKKRHLEYFRHFENKNNKKVKIDSL
jgi:hypothetical protein